MLDRLGLDVVVALREARLLVAAIPLDSTRHDLAVSIAAELDAIRVRLAGACWEHPEPAAAEISPAQA